MTLQPCGTRAAYMRHLKAGEQPCEPCREAKNAYQRQWMARRRAEEAERAATNRADARAHRYALAYLQREHAHEYERIYAFKLRQLLGIGGVTRSDGETTAV